MNSFWLLPVIPKEIKTYNKSLSYSPFSRVYSLRNEILTKIVFSLCLVTSNWIQTRNCDADITGVRQDESDDVSIQFEATEKEKRANTPINTRSVDTRYHPFSSEFSDLNSYLISLSEFTKFSFKKLPVTASIPCKFP